MLELGEFVRVHARFTGTKAHMLTQQAHLPGEQQRGLVSSIEV
jgi:hypothetical protein